MAAAGKREEKAPISAVSSVQVRLLVGTGTGAAAHRGKVYCASLYNGGPLNGELIYNTYISSLVRSQFTFGAAGEHHQ